MWVSVRRQNNVIFLIVKLPVKITLFAIHDFNMTWLFCFKQKHKTKTDKNIQAFLCCLLYQTYVKLCPSYVLDHDLRLHPWCIYNSAAKTYRHYQLHRLKKLSCSFVTAIQPIHELLGAEFYSLWLHCFLIMNLLACKQQKKKKQAVTSNNKNV